MGKEKRLVGRPKAAAPQEGETATLGIQVSAELKRRLNDSADAGGRSLSKEAAFRLEQSFEREDLLASALELAYGPEIAGILLWMAREFAANGRYGAATDIPDANRPWWMNAFAYDLAVRAANVVMERFRPLGDPSRHVAFATAEDRQRHVEWRVAITAAAIKDPCWGDQFQAGDRNRQLERFAAQDRDLLGPELVARIPGAEESR